MKRATITIDHDELEEMVREHMETMFPTLEVENISGLGYSEVTVRLRKPLEPIERAPEAFLKPDDTVQF